jgi:hypothetical protein
VNAADLTVGTTVIDHRRIGRTNALGLYPQTVAAVDHTTGVSYYQLAETGEVRACAPGVDVPTVMPAGVIGVVYLPGRGQPELVRIEPDLETFRALVGGDVQRLVLDGAHLDVRDDSSDFDLPYNTVASRITQLAGRYPVVYGNAVLHGPGRRHGRETSAPAGYLTRLHLIASTS